RPAVPYGHGQGGARDPRCRARQCRTHLIGTEPLMAFTAEQSQALGMKLDARVVRERSQNGQSLSYIEGWDGLAEANPIFCFDGWDRETVSLRCVWEGARGGRHACAYLAQVRIRVRAGETLICRDGHGSGTGAGSTPGEAHENAAKEAETDATKRALVT